MENKKGFSILKLVICIIAILFIAVALTINIAFSKNNTPNFFGTYIYVVNDSIMGDSVTQGSAIMAKEYTDQVINEGDIVLCYPESSNNIEIRSIFKISTNEETGLLSYYTATAAEQGTELSIGSDNIVAICTGNPESLDLGKYITFTTNFKGILLQVILPCIILVIFVVAKIVSSKDDDDGEDYEFYDYDDEEEENNGKPRSHAKPAAPLFEPSQEIQPSDKFERKRMSIAENFSQKEVNPDSPYQKVKDRTMQFKAQRSAESSFAARNVGGQSSAAPVADALREEMLRKTAEAERTGSFSTSLYGSTPPSGNYEPVSDNTGVLSKAQLAEMARGDVPKTTPLKKPSVASTAPKKPSSSPDINDILSRTATNDKKKSASDMSVDDLLAMIENEKKRL